MASSSSSSSLSATGVSQLSSPSGKTTLDYSKWDLIEDEDDLPEPGEGLPMPKGADPKLGLPHYVDRQVHHDESMKLIAQWCKEAYPRQSEEELRQTMAFVAVQHRGVHPTNVMRHLEIVGFLDGFTTCTR